MVYPKLCSDGILKSALVTGQNSCGGHLVLVDFSDLAGKFVSIYFSCIQCSLHIPATCNISLLQLVASCKHNRILNDGNMKEQAKRSFLSLMINLTVSVTH